MTGTPGGIVAIRSGPFFFRVFRVFRGPQLTLLTTLPRNPNWSDWETSPRTDIPGFPLSAFRFLPPSIFPSLRDSA
jgi:hypothetical protein